MTTPRIWVLLGPRTGDNNQALALAEALVLAGRSADAAPIFAEQARTSASSEVRSHAARRAAEEWLKCGRIDEGVAALRGVLVEVGLRYPDSQAEALARALVRILRIRRVEGDFVEHDEREVSRATLARVDAARAASRVQEVLDQDPAHVGARALETRLHEEAGRWELATQSIRARLEIVTTTNVSSTPSA